MNSVEEIENIPVTPGGGRGPYIRDVAQVGLGTAPGQYDRYNQQRMITITSNVSGQDLGGAAREVSEAIRRAGEAPRGVTVNVRGQVPPMQQTLSGLQIGLLLAVVVILLLLTAYFQSLRITLVVLAAIPAVVAGVALALWLTRTTLNVQVFMGAIMAIGVSVANAILLVAFAETQRQEGQDSFKAAIAGAASRLRPILMTSFAMIAGMTPMALAFGEGGEQTAPLGRAVIGGLAALTIAVLTVLPAVFAVVQRRSAMSSPSIHPYDAKKTVEQLHSGVEALLKEAVKAGDLFQPSRGVYQKQTQKSDSADSVAPIVFAESAESTQGIEAVEDTSDWPEWAENDDCGNAAAGFWDSGADEDARIWDAIDR
jgi:Cu/Ag efflux pump CusA